MCSSRKPLPTAWPGWSVAGWFLWAVSRCAASSGRRSCSRWTRSRPSRPPAERFPSIRIVQAHAHASRIPETEFGTSLTRLSSRSLQAGAAPHISRAMNTLFAAQAPHPLADRLRPQNLGEVIGQDHLLGPEGPIGRMVAAKRLASMILWGPPGCGKTTIARLLAQGTDLVFEPLSAVFSGVADLRKVFDGARKRREMGQGTLLFVDEIHRFNRAQQDAFLPVVEDGTVILVGATTENPSFELIGALLSRAQVFVFRRLDDTALETLLARAERHLGHSTGASDARAVPTGEAALRRKA